MHSFIVVTIFFCHNICMAAHEGQPRDQARNERKTRQVGSKNIITADDKQNNGILEKLKNDSPILIDIIPDKVHYRLLGSPVSITCKVYNTCTSCDELTLTIEGTDLAISVVNTSNSGKLKMFAFYLNLIGIFLISISQKFLLQAILHSKCQQVFNIYLIILYALGSFNENRTVVFNSSISNEEELKYSCHCFSDIGIEVCSSKSAVIRLIGKYFIIFCPLPMQDNIHVQRVFNQYLLCRCPWESWWSATYSRDPISNIRALMFGQTPWNPFRLGSVEWFG